MIWGIEVKEALPCPFCGKEPRQQTSHPYTKQSPVTNEKFWFACECGAKGPEAKTESAALNKWNTRK
jgi:Lar family restriction alleviation protein